jgi:hypothetical protein
VAPRHIALEVIPIIKENRPDLLLMSFVTRMCIVPNIPAPTESSSWVDTIKVFIITDSIGVTAWAFAVINTVKEKHLIVKDERATTISPFLPHFGE